MANEIPTAGVQLRSLVKASGELELSLATEPVAALEADEILVRVEASPINPSDLGLLLGPADVSSGKLTQTSTGPVFTAAIAPETMRFMAARVGQSLPVGGEGAGLVVAAGSSPEAQALMGRRVAVWGGAMYAQYRTAKAAEVLPLPADATSAEGASCFVNPLTALGMVATMRREGHTALIHTAAASNLGQMLVKLCLAEGVPLVNIVRSAEQARILRGIGAVHVVDSTTPDFMDSLTKAVAEAGATLAFDAIGGGRLASQILTAMEIAASQRATTAFNRYGSSVHKQVYIYGGLDVRITELARSYGMAWGVGGWLLPLFLAKIDPADVQRLRDRVVADLKTTFASHYTQEVSLAEVLQPDIVVAYAKRATGEKYLVNPSKGLTA